MAMLSRRAQRRSPGRNHGQHPSAPSGKARQRGKSQGGRSGYDRDKIDAAAEREAAAEERLAAGGEGFGKQYGQGFGVGAGRGVESSASGLEGQRLEERDYRGNAGTTF